MSHECRYCGQTFQTRDQLQAHRSTGYPDENLTHEGGELDPNLPMPDFTDPFAPDPESEQALHCLHCETTFSEAAVRYDDRHGQRLWWCPNEDCDGRGVGIDLVPVDAQTPTKGPVAPDRTDVPRGYRSKTIPPTTLPPYWRIDAEERNRDEIINHYHHEHLDLRLDISGVRFYVPGPMQYELRLIAPADAEVGVGYGTSLETSEEITTFDAARDTATELMGQVNHAAHNGADAVVHTALHQIRPDHHHEPDPPDADQACPTCGMATDSYRGNTPEERCHHHREHMADAAHSR